MFSELCQETKRTKLDSNKKVKSRNEQLHCVLYYIVYFIKSCKI